jgi:hypothetical protein
MYSYRIRNFSLGFLASVLVLATACGGQPAPTPGSETAGSVIQSPAPIPVDPKLYLPAVMRHATRAAMATATPTRTPIPSSTQTATPSATPTLEPYGDPDGDDHPTYFEQIWGTDPLTFTSFEELSYLPGTVYAKMRVSQPFAFDDMNGYLYQVARMVGTEDNSTPDFAGDDNFTFETVLFPYATHGYQGTEVEEWPIPASHYPLGLQPYLESTPVYDVTQEMRDTLLAVIAGARTDIEAIEAIIEWNQSAFERTYEYDNLPYSQLASVPASELFSARKLRLSTTRSTLVAAEMKAIGIPSRVPFGVYTHPDRTDCLCGHTQNLVWLDGNWVRLDWLKGLDYGPWLGLPHAYGYLVWTDLYTDAIDPPGDEPPPDFWRWDNHGHDWLGLHQNLEFRENYLGPTPTVTPTPTVAPTPTATPELPMDFQIDGNGEDWALFTPVMTDAEGDTTGGPHTDLKAAYAVTGPDYAYLMIELYDPPLASDPTIGLTMDLMHGDGSVGSFNSNIHPDGSLYAEGDFDGDGDTEEYRGAGALVVRGNVAELALPRAELGDPIGVQPTNVRLILYTDGQATYLDIMLP